MSESDQSVIIVSQGWGQCPISDAHELARRREEREEAFRGLRAFARDLYQHRATRHSELLARESRLGFRRLGGRRR